MNMSKGIGKSEVAAFGGLVLSTDDVPEFTCAAVRERPLVVKSKKEIVERVCGESSGCRPDMHRRTKVDMCDILRDRIGNFSRGFQNARSHNGRFLRHRPERSERCLNYGNCTKAMARCQSAKVCPKGLSVKTMLSAVESSERIVNGRPSSSVSGLLIASTNVGQLRPFCSNEGSWQSERRCIAVCP